MFYKLIAFAICYTVVYLVLHRTGILNFQLTDRDLMILVGMYSMMGFIFSVVSGFVIQSKWHIWDKLVEAGHGEIVILRQLQLVSRHLQVKRGEGLRKKIREYVQVLVKSGATEVSALEELEIEAFESGDRVYDLLEKLLYWKEQKDNYRRRRLPRQLKGFLWFVFVIVVGTSLIFSVHSFWMGLVFSGSVSTMAYFVHLLIEDLDDPYRPGGWYFSSREYEALV